MNLFFGVVCPVAVPDLNREPRHGSWPGWEGETLCPAVALACSWILNSVPFSNNLHLMAAAGRSLQPSFSRGVFKGQEYHRVAQCGWFGLELNSSYCWQGRHKPGGEGKRRDGSLVLCLHSEQNEAIELLSCFGKMNKHKLVTDQSIRVGTNVLRWHWASLKF